MSKATGFWRNVTLIGMAHIAVIGGLMRWSRQSNSSYSQQFVWIAGGAGDGTSSQKRVSISKPRTAGTLSLEAKPSKIEQAEDEEPVMLTAVKSEIQLPTLKPRPKPIITSKASPAPKPVPKPKKTLLAKASLKTPSRVKPASDKKARNTDTNAEERKITRLALAKVSGGEARDVSSKQSSEALPPQTVIGKGASSARNGDDRPADRASEFGWYGSMLHDRFYSEWIQPTANMTSGAKISALVKIRIERDGRVSNFEMVKPSGNVAVDESVAAVAKRVTQVDPLPASLGNSDHYNVRINFELNSE